MRREINEHELSYFYQKTGEAIWHLQFVEEFLCKFYIVNSIHGSFNGINSKNAPEKLKTLSKKTLGQLIGLIETKLSVPNDFLEELKNFNNMRKWIVHNSMRESGNDLYTEIGRNEFLNKSLAFIELSDDIQTRITDMLMKLSIDNGISKDEIIGRAHKEISKLKGTT